MSQTKNKFIQNNAVTSTKVRLDNNAGLRARNAADTADIEMLKLDAGDQVLVQDALGNTSINANARSLVDSSGNPSMDYEARTLLDSTGADAVDFQSRLLKSSTGDSVLNFGTTPNPYRVMQTNGLGEIVESAALTPNRVMTTDTNGAPTFSTTTDTELGYVSGVTSSIQTQLGNKIDTSEKGANNGVATLDAGGKVPASQLPNSVMEYQGTWNASTNTPTLADGTGNAGDVYAVSVAGTQNLGSGAITFAAGDWVIYNGTIWEKSINSNAVASVNGQTGVVTVNAINELTGDVTAGPASGSQSAAATIANLAVTNAKIANSTIDLTTKVTGVLPIGNGGTNSGASLTNNRVMQSSSGSIVEAAAITANRALTSDANGIPTHSTVTDTELGYVSGVTSAIQTQLNGKANTSLSNISGVSLPAVDIVPATTNTVRIGTSGASGFQIQSISARTIGCNQGGTDTGLMHYPSTSYPRTSVWSFSASSTTASDIALQSPNNTTADANATKNVFVSTGNKTAGTGNSGSITVSTGTSAGGTRGDVTLDMNKLNVKDVSLGSASVGYVLTLQNTSTGEVAFAAVASSTTFSTETFVLSGTDITNQYITLAHTPKAGSVHFAVQGAGVLLEGASYDYSISGAQVNFLNDIATGGPSALVAGDIVQVKYAY